MRGSIQLAKPVARGHEGGEDHDQGVDADGWLKNSGCINLQAGLENSARTARIMMPPTKNMMRAKVRYIVPMSLWFVVVSQRRMPLG